MIRFGIVATAIILFFTGCEIFDEKEKIPSYIRIEALSYPGITPHGFTCAFVYVNYKIIGVFELPALIPVLEEGDCRITVRAGIDINDYSYEREHYRMVDPFETRQTLIPGQTTTITPQFFTLENAEVKWSEDFDDSAITLLASDSLTPPLQIVRDVRPGYNGFIGKITLLPGDTLKQYFDYTALDSIPIYFEAVPGYFELSYQSNIPVEVKVKTYNTNSGLIQDLTLLWLRPSADEWRRIYINFASVVRELGVGTFYKPYFRIQRLGENSATDTLRVSVDDIRIIHLK